MKATGIVRRIDDLGRVVIPKEVRRTLRIREGDPLEIFMDKDVICFKKYSPMGELSDFAGQYTESLAQTSGHVCLIADRDTFVAVSGTQKSMYLEKPISKSLEDVIEGKHTILLKVQDRDTFPIVAEAVGERVTLPVISSMVIAPIVSEGDPIGAVVIMSSTATLGEVEKKLAQAAAGFLGKQMEL
jgi:AbrB family transcriptional regulator (stage V sporulation protein T)